MADLNPTIEVCITSHKYLRILIILPGTCLIIIDNLENTKYSFRASREKKAR